MQWQKTSKQLLRIPDQRVKRLRQEQLWSAGLSFQGSVHLIRTWCKLMPGMWREHAQHPYPKKLCPLMGCILHPAPATRCCFPSADLLRNEGEMSSADVPVSDRAHSSRQGTFHHLRIFNPETEVSGLCWLLCWYRRATCERELWLRLVLLAYSSLSLPNL